MKRILLAALAASALSTQALGATTVVVPGTGDLYLAGAPNGTLCCAGDAAPAQSPTPAPLALTPGEVLTFSTTAAATYEPGATFPTADGQTAFTYDLVADYGAGISGPTGV